MDIEKVFSAIKSFVTEINSLYGAHYKPLALYGRLVEKTNLTHTVPVNKHINAFKKFMVSNRNAIYNMNEQDFKPHKIQYNDNVYFNMKTIMNMADPDTQQVIWQHLLVLSALLDPESKAKQRIKETQMAQQQSMTGGGVDPMLSGIMNMVSSVMMDGGGGGPIGCESTDGGMGQIFGQIMSSGILPKMMSTISSSVKDGQIDIGNIVTSVQSLAKECNLDLPPLKNEDEEVDKVLDMFSGLGLDKSKMKEMVNVFQQHVVEDEDENGHVHTEKDTTLIQIPVGHSEPNSESTVELVSETGHVSESVPETETGHVSGSVPETETGHVSESVPETESVPDSKLVSQPVSKNVSEPDTTEPKFTCQDGVCYLK